MDSAHLVNIVKQFSGSKCPPGKYGQNVKKRAVLTVLETKICVFILMEDVLRAVIQVTLEQSVTIVSKRI